MIVKQGVALEKLRNGDLSPNLDAPVSVIREIQEDGTETFIGNIEFFPFPWLALALNNGVETEETKRIQKENNERQPGDPELIWNLGCRCISFVGIRL